jgi:hypothetical protein
LKELLIATLEAFGYPVFLHGSLGDDDPFPPSFFTFITNDSPDEYPFDDDFNYTAWSYQIIFYSSDPQTVQDIAIQSRAALKAAGFIPQGRGRDIPSDEPTHTGWVLDYVYLQKNT